MGVHLLKGLDLKMTEMTFAVFYQGAHLLSMTAGKYSANSRTVPTPGFRAQSIASGQRVSEISRVPTSQKPTSNRTLHSCNNSNFARYQFHSDFHSQVSSFSQTPSSVHLQLGTDHCRTLDPGMCKGISPGVGLPSITEVSPQGLWNERPVGNQGGGEELEGQTGNPGGRTTRGSICKPAIYCAEEGWFSPTSGEPQTSEQLHHQETLQDGRGGFILKSLVQQGDWMVSIDLKDAYLSVVVAEEHRRYLSFQWEHQLYEFLCLLFGLSSAPRTFTKLLKPVMSLIRQQGVRSIVLPDDMLLMTGSRERLLRQVQEIVQLLQLLGVCDQLRKVSTQPNAENSVSRV